MCKRHVHGGCDPEAQEVSARMYVCTVCKSGKSAAVMPPIRSHNPSGGSAHSGS